MDSLFVVYTYKTVSGQLECHIYSGEPNAASWNEAEATAELAALKAADPTLYGMVLPIEMVSATPAPGA